ncbi:hypothetical protein BDZ89DRAFT_1129861 [Hymenopellis radicata]|nr:hypothetical protein BDZ89DRAFT_1129861 [Hymenopellis radicata]
MSDFDATPILFFSETILETAEVVRGLTSFGAEYLEASERLRSFVLSFSWLIHDNADTILKLVEISRDTLLRLNIQINPASFCKYELRDWKAAYFNLLHALRARRNSFPFSTQDRVARLTLPLAYRPRWLGEGRPAGVNKVRRIRCGTTRPYSATQREPENDSHLMPPPAKIPTSRRKPSGPPMVFPPEITRQFLVTESNKGREDPEDGDQEQRARPLRLQPLTKRFGIFCGSSVSMFRMRD